jgi:hypothetical protein
MAGWAYDVFNLIGLAGLLGLVVYLARPVLRRLREKPAFTARRDEWRALLQCGELFGKALALVWPVVVFASWVQWASVTWSSQGRLVYSALTAIAVWLAVGLAAWAPARYRAWVLGAAVGFFAVCAVTAPFAWIEPAYAQPPEIDAAQLEALADDDMAPIDFYEPGADDETPAMRLLGYEVETDAVMPGESVPVTLYWEITGSMSRNWSVFVHLEDFNQIPVAQRDTYPGVGLLATRDLEPGCTFADRYVVRVPEGTYAPDTLTLTVGLYDYTTCPLCERMQAVDFFVSLHEITLLPIEDNPYDLPNPTRVNFGDKAELVGFALDTRHAAPGDDIDVTLYWRSLAEISQNYTVFVHLVGEDNHIWANGDAWPAGGAAPTSAWQPGDIVEDVHTLSVDPNTPPGVYPVEVGFFVQKEDGSFERLVVVTGDANLQHDYIYLTQVRIE